MRRQGLPEPEIEGFFNDFNLLLTSDEAHER